MNEENSRTIPTISSKESLSLQDASAAESLTLPSLSLSFSTSESEEEPDSEITELLIRISNVLEMIQKELLDIQKFSKDGGYLHSVTQKTISVLQLKMQKSGLNYEINERDADANKVTDELS